jgi:ribonuclease Z
MRWRPLRVVGPYGRTPELGTAAMVKSLQQMCNWHTYSFMSLPVGEGFEAEVTVTVRHWRRSHTMDGASGYRLDWNGLSFVWTGDGKPDQLTAKFAMGADVFVTEMEVDSPALWALRQGTPRASAPSPSTAPTRRPTAPTT